MIKQLLILSFITCFFTLSTAQIKNKTYDYIVVPEKFDFLTSKDAYKLNTLFRYLFKKENHTVFYNSENITLDRCKGIYADVLKLKGSFIKSKLQVVIKDCTGIILFESEVGESKEKEYKKAYQEALRKAFNSVKAAEIDNVSSNNTKKKEALKSVIQEPKPEKLEQPKKVMDKPEMPKMVKEAPKMLKEMPKMTEAELLYAQKTELGYQLIDKTPKVVMLLLHTSINDVYIVKDQNAVVYKKDEKWWLSKGEDRSKSDMELNIKF